MEAELEPRVKQLAYKVKAISRESPAQKAAHVLDTDLRNHWSTATNTKEWILLELDEPALLSHIRIYNKSVLEWEISAGLRYKPETFVKVRQRSEAPRRDMTYPVNYTPCRYVRISCMRGNPIAIFFIQLIGIPVAGLEPEFQPVVNYLLPYIISQKQDAGDMHLQLLQDVTSRLARFVPYLEVDLNDFPEAAEPTIRFLAMLAGPFYPILQIVNERETARLAANSSDTEVSKPNVSSTALTVSSNFEPRKSRNAPSVFLPISGHVVFRADAIFMLLRKAYKDSKVGDVCRTVSRIIFKLMEPMMTEEASAEASDITASADDGAPKSDACRPISLTDYSDLFGKEFHIPDDHLDPTCLNLLDNAAVEEGLMHVLYASASQPLHCSKLADNTSDIWLTLPLIQALLPALRPTVSSTYQIDDNFSLWKQPFVQNAMTQIVATSSSMIYRPLLRACSGYLSSFSPSHAKAACVLIDLCSGVLAPWVAQVIAKVDLAVELLMDLLGVIQGARLSLPRARAALKYIILALSGNVDDIMRNYKDAKLRILFLVEMLEPFLDPVVNPLKGIVFGNESSIFVENQEKICAIAVNVIRRAVKKVSVLPSLETEWRRGSVSPSVLLSVLDAQMQLPPDIDCCKYSSFERGEPRSLAPLSSRNGASSSRSNGQESTDVKVDDIDTNGKIDVPEDASLLFAPTELNRMSLTHGPASTNTKFCDANRLNSLEVNNVNKKPLTNRFQNDLGLDACQGIKFFNLLTDYSQLMNYRDCELKASEFRRLALDLNSQSEITPDGQDVAIDALLLAAECYIVPRFMNSLKDISPDVNKISAIRFSENHGVADISRTFKQKDNDLKLVADIERKRDRLVIELLIEAAKLHQNYHKVDLEDEITESYVEGEEGVVNLSDEDTLSADAVTLVRQNQSLLCRFLIQRLRKNALAEQRSTHEILMWCLLFLLHSATKLFCSPEHVVDLILNFAESLNVQLKSFHYKCKEGNTQLSCSRLHEVQHSWSLLQRLIVASSGNDERSELSINVQNGFRFSNLVPNSAWLLKIPAFSSSSHPLVRYFGWMAVARNAKQYLKERLFLLSDLSQLTCLLSIFSDDLSLVDNVIDKKSVALSTEEIRDYPNFTIEHSGKSYGHQDGTQSFHALYPDISKLFPNLKNEFEAFGETILEAVGLQLKFLSSTVVPDLISWFADLCSWPILQSEKGKLFPHNSDHIKGFVAKNAKAVILYILEAIVVEHMEAMVPEIPRVVQVLVSLCRTSYCDVVFLDSILRLLKPIIIYSLSKVSDEEKLLIDELSENFESLCFGKLFNNIKCRDENEGTPTKSGKCPALTIFVLATIFGDLSFKRKTELLKSTILWSDFASFEETTVFHDYLCAYQALMENCKDQLISTLRVWGIIPLKMPLHSTVDDFSKSSTWFLNDIYMPSPTEMTEKHQDDNTAVSDLSQSTGRLTLEEIKSFSNDLEALVLNLNPTIEQCWKVHHKLAKELALMTAECFFYSRCLSLFADKVPVLSGVEKLIPSELDDESPDIWRISLEGFAKNILLLQENQCWEVAFVYIYSIFGLPKSFPLDYVVADICLAIKNVSNCAPNISWRLQTDNMISLLLARKPEDSSRTKVPFVNLFSVMLGHPEPEQRYIALKHLGRFIGQGVDERTFLPSITETMIDSSDLLLHSASEHILSPLVSATWDHVALVASSDTSLLLRTRATGLLIDYIPFMERNILQSFLTAADSILHCLTSLALPTCYGPLTQFSLALVASVCLYSPAEDISLIPESIWSNIETIAMSRNGRYCTGFEKRACEALYRLKNDEDQAKQILKELLSSSSPKEEIPDFVATRESILQVIGNLTSARSYFDFFAKEADQKTLELEEAEMEIELLKRESQSANSSLEYHDCSQLPFLSTYVKDEHRLQQIKDEIRSVEKAKLKEDIVARRQQKLLVRRARQQFLENAALREAELLQKFDRERTSEVEKELERRQLLELERAKTRELRHNLDLEKEKQAQRELQRELEQVESGIRPSRREYPSSSQSRTRDRYRERENDREGNEGNLRTSSSRSAQRDTVLSNSTSANVPTVVLSGTRSFSGQLPTILQQRSDDTGSIEDNFEGSRDSGDTASVGDPDLDVQSIGFGTGQRHGGSRAGKPRQIVERRERDSRREGKWEQRKHQ